MIEAEIVHDKKRECGDRKKGGIYLMAGTGGSPDGVLPLFVLINPPVPNPGKFHRGPIIVNGNAILNRLSYNEWLAGPSKERKEKQEGDAWAIKVFGMTAYKRCHTGDCAGLGVDEALEHLRYNVFWDRRILQYIRQLTIQETADMAAEPFASLVRACQKYDETNQVKYLIDVVSACWRLADAIPPSKRSKILPNIVSILTLLGLVKDAVAMRKEMAWQTKVEDPK